MSAIFSGGPTFLDANGTFYAAPGRWLYDQPELSPALYQILFGSAPGVNGSYSINFGLRSQDFTLRVLYVDTTTNAVLSMWATDAASLIGPVDAVFGPVGLKRCFIDAASSKNTPIEKIISSNGNVYYMMYASIHMSSKGG